MLVTPNTAASPIRNVPVASFGFGMPPEGRNTYWKYGAISQPGLMCACHLDQSLVASHRALDACEDLGVDIEITRAVRNPHVGRRHAEAVERTSGCIIVVAAFESSAVIAGLDDVTVMGKAGAGSTLGSPPLLSADEWRALKESAGRRRCNLHLAPL
ncbi:hypothetical protein ACVWXO_009099 [Bradyrhizobium sp. LM2.7]